MAIKVLELTNTDRQFYPTMGPFLANRDVHKALGGVPWDEDTKTWLIAKDGRKGVLGFVGVAARGNRIIVESLYTLPGLKRVASELVGAAVARFGGRELHAMARHAIADAYTDSGFEITSTTREFASLIRPATPESERV